MRSSGLVCAVLVSCLGVLGGCRDGRNTAGGPSAPAGVVTARSSALTSIAHAGWTASASQTQSGSPASKAIDADGASRWTTGDIQTNQWFKVDLGAPRAFVEVEIWSNGTDYPRQFNVQVSNDNSTWTTVKSATGTSSLVQVPFAQQQARYVRIQLATSGQQYWLSIYDFNVYSTQHSTATWAATSSGITSPDTEARGIDTSLTTKWTSSTAQSPNAQWYQVDMRRRQTFNMVSLDGGATSNTTYPRGYKIEASDDASSWSTLATGTGAAGVIFATFTTTQARYLKVTQTGTATAKWSLYDLLIYGQPEVPSVLSQVGWTATASKYSQNAGLSIDSQLSTGWSTETYQAVGDWYQVDMGASRLVSGITMDSETSTDYARAFNVYVSDDPMNFGSPAGSGAGTGPFVTATFAPKTGRYVRVQLTSLPGTSDWWQFCEFNVQTPALARAGWIVSASSTAGTDEVRNAFDNNSATRWDSAESQATEHSVTVDLVTQQIFNKVTLDASPSPSSAGNYPRSYEVYVSNDGTTWGAAVATGSGTGQAVTIGFASQTARYIKIRQPAVAGATNSWSIHELEVFREASSCATVTCTASDQCHDVGTCDPLTGTCSNPVKANGTSCTDGNACTQTDTCQSGTCTGANPITCTASDQCHTAGTCSPATGTCSNPAKSDGTTCSDGDSCTQTDTCVAGTCTGASPVTCTASDQCHAAGTCNPANGTCSNPAKSDGTTCSDGNSCTQTDTCVAGTCTGASPVTCTASDQCHTAGTCNPANGTCSNPAKSDGATCSDGNLCTQSDTCVAGTCAGSSPVTCTASDQCHTAGTCNPASGACSNPAKSDGTTCSDGNLCTQSDTCVAGTCTGASPVTCTASDQCHTAGTCNPTTGACSTVAQADGTTCNDGSSCTTGDVCTGGACAGSGSCNSQIGVTLDFGSSSLQPSLPLSVSADRTGVHAGDVVNITASATFDGVAVHAEGRLNIANSGSSEYVVPGYSISVEYLSTTSQEWVPVARRAFDASGQLQPPTALHEMTFDANVVVIYDWMSGTAYELQTPGVTYAEGRMAGTRIASGATAISFITSGFVIPPDLLSVLADPAQALSLRQVVKIDAGAGLPNGAEVVTPINLPPAGNLVVTNLTGSYYYFGRHDLAPSTIPSLALSSTATFTAAVPIASLLTPSEASGQAGGYVGYLGRLAADLFSVNADVFGDSPDLPSGVWSSNYLELPFLVPVIEPKIVSNFMVKPAGYPITLDVTLENKGTESASSVALLDIPTFDPSGAWLPPATILAPSVLSVGETHSASITYENPSFWQGGLNVQGEATWKDSVGNVYGPRRTNQWSGGFNAPRPLGTIALAGQTTAPVPVGSVQTLTAMVTDPHARPAVGITVQLSIAGANPKTISAVTDTAGVAHFSYEGRYGGGDTLMASATVTTAPTQSNSVSVFWSAPYGTPCTSPNAPLDVVIAIDTSSSMEGPNLVAAKAAARSFLDTMDLSRDQLGIVSFGGVGSLNVGLTSDFGLAAAGIDSVQPGGGFINPTNIGAGLSVALDEITSTRHRPTATPIIVFVSDGGNSFGDPESALARLATAGIRTFAFALGADVDFAMLKRIATSRNELFYTPNADGLVWLYSALRADLCRNQAPLAYAGGDQGAYGVRLPHPLTLRGEVHDDGPIALTTSEWSVVSGPGVVTFLDASSPETTAVFSDPGTYVLRITGSDGAFTATDDATITVDPEPSLIGAHLVASLVQPGPLVQGSAAAFQATLTDALGHPINDYPVHLVVSGPNPNTATLLTDSNGVVTLTYVGLQVGTDVLTATALALDPVSSTPLSLAWTGVQSPSVATQGWIGAPSHQSTVTGQAAITVANAVTITNGTLSYWPASAPERVKVVATGVSGAPGATLATIDTTVLANGPYVVKLDATNDAGASQVNLIALTVGGDYKPGRVVVEMTDMTIPVAGIPVTVGRRYDSLERENVGDFGHGWSLMIGHPRLDVDAAHNVTITMPDNRRVTFFFTPTFPQAGPVIFGFFLLPRYTPEPGVYGTLKADGCPLLAFNPYAEVANPSCFGALEPGDLPYAPTTYTYTDQFGRVFTMGASGELRSIKDRQDNTLTFTAEGISSSTGVTVSFERDGTGRITKITSPALDAGNGKVTTTYEYDGAGDLVKVNQPELGVGPSPVRHTYDTNHLLLTSKDGRGNNARTSTYDTAGHLLTDTDALGNVTSYAYDFGARKTTTTNPDTGTVERTFDSRGLLLEEIDPLGRKTTHTYDANRNELSRKNALNEVTTFTYDGNGNQTSVTKANGDTKHITYNQLSQPVASTDADSHTTTIAYDERGIPTKFNDEIGTLATFTSSEHGLPLTVTDAAGNTTYSTYDAAGNLTSRVDRLGRRTVYGYDGMGRRTSETDPRGGLTRHFYRDRGVLNQTWDAMGYVMPQYEWDNNANPTFERTRYGHVRYLTYNVLNQLTKVRHEDSTTIEYTRDFRGNALTMKDESGRTTTYEYDKAGQLLKTTYPDSTFTTRAYDALGRLVTATDERGNATTYEYEAGCGCADRVTKLTDALNRATVTTYDHVGRRTSVTNAANHTTAYEYDARGHLTTTTYADGTTETDAYDTRGRRISHTDQMGSVTDYGYDDEGQLISVTDALEHVTQYAYDGTGNLTTVTDANNHTTSYEYDLLSRKTKRTLPLGMYETFAYNLYNDQTSHRDFRGKTTTNTYDTRSRLLTKVPDATLSEPTATFTYNPTGTRLSMADGSGTTSYTYDTRDRLLTKGTTAGALTYTYDPAGNVATVRSSNTNGTSVDYVWDAANQLVSVTDNRAGGATASAYTATGRPSTLTQPSGVGATFTYDTRDRVSSLAWQQGTSPAFGSWTYGFNLRGQRTSVTDVTGRHVAYGYDAVSRLSSETITNDPQGSVGNGELIYSFDPTGSRLSRSSTLASLGAQSFSYDANDQLGSDSYDANGNTTAADGHTYTYDFENRLKAKDGTAVTIVYDGDGNRVAKTVGGVTTKYLAEDLNPTGYLQVLEEVSGGAVQVAYTYGTTIVSQRRVGVSGAMSYYGYDAHGNVTFLTDATGSVTDTYDYDAWGNVVAHAGTTPNTRSYAGEELDLDLGLVNARARYYDPHRGRFLTVDPLLGRVGAPPSMNRYLYAEGDPVGFVDPSGMSSVAVGYGLRMQNLAINAAKWTALGLWTVCLHNIGVSAMNIALGERALAPIMDWCMIRARHKPDPPVLPAEPGKSIRGLQATMDDVLAGAKPGRETKGRSEQWEKPGDVSDADRDFDSLGPSNVRDIPGGGRVGTLPDGRTVVVRPDSKDGRPTLEVQDGKDRTKVRYGDK